jgi:phage/plasmid-like protein (TIGR03299 family)
MPHEVETMMYAGEVPWHGLGKRVAGLQTAEEAIKAAGLDWEVELAEIFTRNDDGLKKATDYRAVRRITDKRVYGIVSPKYQPIQNRDAFRFFDEVVGSKKAIYETAGSLRGGQRIWILANLKGTVGVKGDEIKRYLTLTNSHDGSLALQMFFSPVRVVCMNTLRMALARASNSFYCRHTLGALDRIEAAREILGLATQFYTDWLKEARHLATLQLPAPKVPLLLNAAFNQPDSIKMEDIYNPIQVQMKKVEELITQGRGQDNPAIQGTAWQGYNAVAEYADYYRPYRSQKKDARLNGAWFGSGMAMKKRAWDFLMKL